MNENFILLILPFVYGACIGSFLNVIIARVPSNLSIIAPGSHCNSCKAPIKYYDNIPIISYFILSGKCRSCSSSFSAKYILIESLSAALTASLFFLFGLTTTFFIYTTLVYMLIAITFIDIDHLIIPDSFILFGIFILFVATLAGWAPVPLKSSISGALFFSLFLLVIGFIGSKVLKKDAMGGGDVKLGFILGSFLGFKISILTLYLSFIISAVVILLGLVTKQISMKTTIPFGPYLATGTIIVLLSNRIDNENILLDWYYSLVF